MVENGFVLCLPDAATKQLLTESVFPCRPEHLHCSVLVLKQQIQHVQDQLCETKGNIFLATPLKCIVRGIGSLTTRAGMLLTVLNIEVEPCQMLKKNLMQALNILETSDVYGESQQFHVSLMQEDLAQMPGTLPCLAKLRALVANKTVLTFDRCEFSTRVI